MRIIATVATVSLVSVFLVLLGSGHPRIAHAADPAPKPAAGSETLAATAAIPPGTESNEARIRLGLLLLSSKKPAERAEGEGWLILAAEEGSAPAAMALVDIYTKGQGVKANPAAAENWLYRAADLGDMDARRQFLDRFLSGQISGVIGPYTLAWLEEAASAGDQRALWSLADLYRGRRGAIANPQREYYWLVQAAKSGQREAQAWLGLTLLQQPSQWQVKKDNITFLTSDRQDRNRPGVTLVRPDMTEGEYWLRQAANNDDPQAQYWLATLLLKGVDLPARPAEAVLYLQKSAHNAYRPAQMLLADLMLRGHGVLQSDPVRAWMLWDQAAIPRDNDDSDAAVAAALRDSLTANLTDAQKATIRRLGGKLPRNGKG